MILIWIVLAMLVGHWLGDFVFQRHQWSLDKSSSNLALTKHVVMYTVTLYMAVWIVTPQIAFEFALVNGAAHWVIDYITARVNKRLWAAERVHDFFVSVGFDQLLHYTVMLLSFAYLTSLYQ